MKRNWELDELIEHFTFLPNEMQQIGNKSSETRIGFAVMFKFFQYEARFPFHKFEVPKVVISYIAKQIEVPAKFENFLAFEKIPFKIHKRCRNGYVSMSCIITRSGSI